MEKDPDRRPTVTRREWAIVGGFALAVAVIELAEDRVPLLDHGGVVLQAALYASWGWAAHKVASAREGWERHAWRWFSAAGWMLAFQAVAFGAMRVADPAFAATIATREAAPVLAYPLLIVGLLALARRRSRSSVVLRALDAALVAGGVFFMLWSAVFRDLYAGSPHPIDERFELMAYPTFGAAVAACAWLILGREGRRLPAYRLLAIAATVPLLTDTYGSVLGLQGIARGGRIGDLGLMASGVLWVLAARVAARAPPWPVGEVPPTSRLENNLPLVAMGLALATALQTVNEHGAISSLQFWLAAALIVLLLLRMAITLAQNTKLEASLRNLLDERTRLLRFVSHELANPISPLTLQMAILRRDASDEATRARAFEVMDRSVGRLQRLSNDVRALAMAETGRLVVKAVDGDVGDLLRRAVQAAAGDGETKGIDLRLEADEGLVLPMDAERIGQVVDNLLSNALKFTPTGGHVVVKARRDGDDVRIEVIDDGLGLDADQVQALFQAFQRFHPGVAPGLGLGLHLSRTLVEAHQGRMGAWSPGPKRGATFWFTLPTTPALAQPPAALAAAPTP